MSNAAQFFQLQREVFDYDIDLTGFEDSKNSESSLAHVFQAPKCLHTTNLNLCLPLGTLQTE